MLVGDVDGYGEYGVLDEDGDGLLCHDCGHRFTHLGLHVWRAHGVTADEYREVHGLGRRGLVVSETRARLAENARTALPSKHAFLERRDPARATQARLDTGTVHSPAGLEAMRQTRVEQNRQRRLRTVVVCCWCEVEFCPLKGAKRRRFCSRSCASKHTRSRGRDGVREIDLKSEFAPIDDVMEALEALPGIDDDRNEREVVQAEAEGVGPARDDPDRA